MRLRTLLALAALSATVFAQAPAKRPMTFADLQAMKRVSDPQISPSGKWVLFSVTDVSLEKNSKTNHLWIVPLAGGKEVQLTTGAGESNGRFSPDGQYISFTAAPGKGESVSRIVIADWNDATAKLGAQRALLAISDDADGAIWSPDSKRLLFTTQVYPECSDELTWAAEDACDKAKDEAANNSPVKAQLWDHLLYRHWNAYTGLKRTHVLVTGVRLAAENVYDLTPRTIVGDAETPTFSLGGPLGYAWAPDSKEIAYVTNLDKVPAESTNNDIFTLKLDEPGAKPVKVSTSPGSDDGPQYSPDGKWLAWRSQKRAGFESDKFDLVVMNRANGEIKQVAPDFGGWVDEYIWYPNSGSFYFTSSFEGQECIYHTGMSGEVVLIRKGGEFSSLQFVQSSGLSNLLIAAKMKVDIPTELVLVTQSDANMVGVNQELKPEKDMLGVSVANSSHEKQLTQVNSKLLATLDLSAMESFWFHGANGTKVQGFLIKPPNFDPAKKYPLKFLIHGGPQGAWGDAWSYRWNPELFAANGYVVVMINPRGSTGYGQQFVDEVSGDWGGRPYIDLMKGLDYAEKTYPFIDKTRECALGASYGGFMADWILTHTDRFACIVTHDGAYNLQSMFGTTEELWFPEWEFRPLVGNGPDAVVEQTKSAHPWDFAELPADKDPFRKWSPRMYIDQAKTPTLVIHGQKDYRLDVSEGLQLFTALQLRGVPSKMLYFPDEGHWVLKPQNSQLWYDTVNDWCDQWTHTNKYAK